jgi:hypothetical protein
MKLLRSSPDGGKGSGVTAYFLVEWKQGFSIALLHFRKGTREAYHSHAFNAWTWWLKGNVLEHYRDGTTGRWSAGDLKYTPRSCFHKIEALTSTWALSIRGPWSDVWEEDRAGKLVRLTHGRKEI